MNAPLAIDAAPQQVTFAVPGEPVGKGRPRATRQGRIYTPKKTASYEAKVQLAAFEAMNGREPFHGPVMADLVVCVTPPRSWSRKRRAEALDGLIWPTKTPDIDNVVKAVLDGCNGIVFRDDKLVTCLRAEKRYAETPRVNIAVHTIFGRAAP